MKQEVIADLLDAATQAIEDNNLELAKAKIAEAKTEVMNPTVKEK